MEKLYHKINAIGISNLVIGIVKIELTGLLRVWYSYHTLFLTTKLHLFSLTVDIEDGIHQISAYGKVWRN